MDEAVLEERRLWGGDKAFEAAWKDLAKIKPNIFTANITAARSRPTKRTIAVQDRAFADAAASIMHLGPELFRSILSPPPSPPAPKVKKTKAIVEVQLATVEI